MSKIIVVRLKGLFSISPKVEKTFESMRLNKLYSCAVIEMTPSFKGMLQAVKDFTAYGDADKETVALLLAKRGKSLDGKCVSDSKKPEEIAKLASEIVSSTKSLEEFGILNLFPLSPPKGGFDGSRKSGTPYEPLGRNTKISELISKMA